MKIAPLYHRFLCDKQKSSSLDELFCLEAPPRFELGVKALQASALPLGYGALRSKRAAQALLEFVLERKTRFELATFALARRRSTTEPLPQNVATRMRLELTTSSVTG